MTYMEHLGKKYLFFAFSKLTHVLSQELHYSSVRKDIFFLSPINILWVADPLYYLHPKQCPF